MYSQMNIQMNTQIGSSNQTPKSNKTFMPKKGIIHHLRKNGFKIRIRHFRYAIPTGSSNAGLYLVTHQNRKQFSHIASWGGMTEVDVTFPDGYTTTTSAVCNQADTYCRRTGAYYAFRRAQQRRLSNNSV